MAKASKGKKGKGGVSVNFKGVDAGGRSIRDGWAVGKITEAELTTAKESGNEMFKIVIQAKNGKQTAKVWDNLVLTPNALWKMRSLLEAAGVEVDEEDDMKFTADDLLDLEEFDVEVVNEDYEGRPRPRVAGFAALGTHTNEDGDDDDEDSEEDDEDEKPTKRLKSKKASKADDDEDEDEEDEDSDDDEDEDEDEPPKKGKSKKASKDDDEDDEDDEDEDEESDDDDEDEDEEEDEKPKKKGKKSKAKFKAGQKVKFEDDKGKTKSGVITSIDDDTVFVEDQKGEEWELSSDEIIA
jgi:ribosomal protein L12E/L44/L45/RPP1/RPP2